MPASRQSSFFIWITNHGGPPPHETLIILAIFLVGLEMQTEIVSSQKMPGKLAARREFETQQTMRQASIRIAYTYSTNESRQARNPPRRLRHIILQLGCISFHLCAINARVPAGALTNHLYMKVFSSPIQSSRHRDICPLVNSTTTSITHQQVPCYLNRWIWKIQTHTAI